MQAAQITFEQMPQMLHSLTLQFANLSQYIEREKQKEGPEILTTEQAAEFLGVQPETLLKTKEIPRSKRLRRVYFLRSDLIKYIEEGKVSNQSILKRPTK